MPPIYKSIYLYTNRNWLVFDLEGAQVPEAQDAVTCYAIDRVRAQQIIDQAEQFYIAKWGKDSMRITRTEMEYMLGLRSHERDIKERPLG